MAHESVYLMTPMEVAWGYLFGHVGALAPPTDPSSDPRRALAAAILPALLRPPCGVSFSGGRDSSVVLAVATDVARREGLAEPVPITKVFPDAPETAETEWQELVLRHLGLGDWQRVVLHDELDLLGPLATRRLVEHGVTWPPTIQTDIPVLEFVRSGSLLDGEGGDEVLDVAPHRIAALTRLLRAPRPLRPGRIRPALLSLAPSSLRVPRRSRRAMERTPTPWLRPPARAGLAAELDAVERSAPLSFAASVRMVPCRRTQVLAARNRRVLSRPYDVEMSSPFLHGDVVHALARHGGRLGRVDRTATLRDLVSDLLPDAVLARSTKAEFSGAFWSSNAPEFAERWSGVGVDSALVDADVLRRMWCSGERNALTGALLQQAWLADRDRSIAPLP